MLFEVIISVLIQYQMEGCFLEYRILGKTGLNVSSVGIGCWQMASDGSWGSDTNDKQSIETIHKAQEIGVNLLDTAASYGNGHSEEVIGKAIQGRRSNFIIASKVKPEVEEYDIEGARRQIIEICEASLNRLQTDYIDVYQLHRDPTPNQTPVFMEALNFLKQQGKIRFIGSSTNNVPVLQSLMKHGDLSVVQIGYNLINRGGEATLKFAKNNDIGTLIRMPLASGALTGKYFNIKPNLQSNDLRKSRFTSEKAESGLKRLSDLLFLTKGDKRTMIQAALKFVLDTDGVCSVIPGAKNVKQLEENANTVNVASLSTEERALAMEIAGEVGSFSSLGVIQS